MKTRYFLILSLLAGCLFLTVSASKASSGHKPALADTFRHWLAVGDSLRQAKESQAALKAYDSVLVECRHRSDKQGEADVLRRRGEAYNDMDDFQAALKDWEEALKLYRQTGRQAEEGDLLRSIGSLHDDLGEYPQALKNYDECLQIARKMADDKLAAQVLNNIGVVYDNLSEPRKALEYYRQSLELRRKLKDVKGEAGALNNMGMAYDALSAHRQALDLYRQSLAKYTSLGDSTGLSRVLGNLGVVYEKISDYPKALEAHRRSLAIKIALGNRRGESATLNNIGIIYDLLYDPRRALTYYHRSLEIAAQLKDPKGQAQTLDNIGVSCTYLHDYPKALEGLQHSLALKTELGDMNGQDVTLKALGDVYEAMEDYSKALDYYQQDLHICEQMGDRVGECITLAHIGEVYTKQTNYGEANKALQRALNSARDQNSDDAFQPVYHVLGEYYAAQDQDSMAVLNFEKVITSHERIRKELEIESHKRTFAQGASEIYGELIQALLRQDKSQKAFEYCERSRARAFLDLLAGEGTDEPDTIPPPADSILSAGLGRSIPEPELPSPVSVETLTLPQVQHQLSTNSTLLEYFISAKQTAVWVITHEDAQVFQIAIGSDSLQNLVRGLRDAILNGGAVDKRARGLYNLLIKPLQTGLRFKDLIIVPHGILHYLPFALLENEAGKCLLDNYAIRILPSASVLSYLPDHPRDPAGKLLALGNPHTDRAGYPSLPFSENEVKAIARELPQCDAYYGSAATESLMKRLAPKYSLLHLACHSDLDASYPLFSGLLLSPGNQQDGELYVHEIFKLKLNVWLVTLSACRTGLGYLTNGDDLVGLSRAFIYAGTPSVLVSLWQVEDESTSFLMTRFYHHLASGDKAQALRQAQLETRSRYGNARSWAAFELIGKTR